MSYGDLDNEIVIVTLAANFFNHVTTFVDHYPV